MNSPNGVQASRELEPTLSIHAESSEVSRASFWLQSMCAQAQVPVAQMERLDTCLNEVLANILAHGQIEGNSKHIRLDFLRRRDSNNGEVALSIADHGVAFDPLSAPLNSLPGSLAEAEPGGLGLVMLRRFSDRLDYFFADGQNKLTITVRWKQELA